MSHKIKAEDLTVHHLFAKYFKDDALEPYIYVLSKRMESGHICIPINESIKEEMEEGGYSYDASEYQDSNILGVVNHENFGQSTVKKPFILFNSKLYFQRYFVYEGIVLKQLETFAKLKDTEIAYFKEKLSSQKTFISNVIADDVNLEGYTEDEKVDWQAIAAILGCLNKLTIITGGPGTGKTTTVAKILAILNKIKNDDVKIALAAPTGKAAVRMKESLESSAQKFPFFEIDSIINDAIPSTIHRLLGTKLNSPFFKFNRENKLPYDVIIIDESSMIGVALFAKLLEAIKEDCKIIILGDSEQLASVDAGSLFGDVCFSQNNSENVFSENLKEFLNKFLLTNRRLIKSFKRNSNFLNSNFVRLKKTHRFNQNSTLGKFNTAVIQGDIESIKKIVIVQSTEDLILDFEYNKSFLNEFILKYKGYIEEDDISKALKNINQSRILCAVKSSDQGVYAVNETIKELLKKEYKGQKDKFNPSTEIFNNQLIMVTKNQPSINLFNGDVGLVRCSGDKLKVFFPKQKRNDIPGDKDYFEVTPGFIESWETVFAMTIHKSQGSEFDEVLVVLPKNKENKLLTRELVYTGITRAKLKAYIQTSEEVLYSAVSQKVERVSGLTERILNL